MACDKVDDDGSMIEANDVAQCLVATGAGLSDEEAMAIAAVFAGDEMVSRCVLNCLHSLPHMSHQFS